MPVVATGQYTITDSRDGLSATLTHYSAIVAADSDGIVLSWAGATTTMVISIGGIDDSINWTYSVDKTNLTCDEAATSRVQTVSGMSANIGWLDITASKTGYNDITLRFTVAKSIQGADGDPATMYYIKPVTGTAIKNGVGTLTIEARKIAFGVDTLLDTGDIQLYDNLTLLGDGYSATLDASDIDGSLLVELKDPGGAAPTTSQVELAVSTVHQDASEISLPTITYPNFDNMLLVVSLYTEAATPDMPATLTYNGAQGVQLSSIANSTTTKQSITTYVWDQALIASVNAATKGSSYALTSTGWDNTAQTCTVSWFKNAKQTTTLNYTTKTNETDSSEIFQTRNGIKNSLIFALWDGSAGTGITAWSGATSSFSYNEGTTHSLAEATLAVGQANGDKLISLTAPSNTRMVMNLIEIQPETYMAEGGDPTIYDSITLVDVTDGVVGNDAIYGSIAPSNGLAWVRSTDGTTWVPAANTTILTGTFYQSGASIATAAVTITRDANGNLTHTANGSSGSGAAAISWLTTGSGTKNVTVKFTHTSSGMTVSESVFSALSGIDGDDGTVGISVAELGIYIRSANPPATPTGGSFNFGTQLVTPPASWTAAMPTGNDPLYHSRGVASVVGDTGIDSSITWSAPTKVNSDGSSVDIVFVRAASQPATPDDSAGVPTSPITWYSDISSVPAGANPLWSSVGTRANPGLPWTWQVPTKITADDAKLVYIYADRMVIGYDYTGTATNTNAINFSITTQNTSTSKIISLHKSDGTQIDAGAYLTPGTGLTDNTPSANQFTQTGNTFTMTIANFTTAIGTTDGIIVTVTVDSISDKISINKISQGPPGETELPNSYYIKATNGTVIKNGSGTLTLEAHGIINGVDTKLSTGDIKLYADDEIVTVANGWPAGSDGYTGVFDATAIGADGIVVVGLGTVTEGGGDPVLATTPAINSYAGFGADSTAWNDSILYPTGMDNEIFIAMFANESSNNTTVYNITYGGVAARRVGVTPFVHSSLGSTFTNIRIAYWLKSDLTGLTPGTSPTLVCDNSAVVSHASAWFWIENARQVDMEFDAHTGLSTVNTCSTTLSLLEDNSLLLTFLAHNASTDQTITYNKGTQIISRADTASPTMRLFVSHWDSTTNSGSQTVTTSWATTIKPVQLSLLIRPLDDIPGGGGGSETWYDSVTVLNIVDGTSSANVQASLTKNNVTIYRYESGSYINLADSVGEIKVTSDNADVTASATYTTVSTTAGLTVQLNTSTNQYFTGAKGAFRVTAITVDNGSVVFKATYGGVEVLLTYSVTRIKVGYESAATLPVADLYAGRIVYNTTDKKLYTHNGTNWETTIASVSGTVGTTQIADGAITLGKIADNQLTTAKFASGLEPITVVSSVPGTKSTNFIYNSTDKNLYRWNGSAYIKEITESEISGTISGTKITANSITAGQIATAAITADELAANAVTASKILIGGNSVALNKDPMMTDINSFGNSFIFGNTNPVDTGYYSITNPDVPVAGVTCLRYSGSLARDFCTKEDIYIDVNKSYRISFWIRRTNGVGVTYATVAFFDNTGTLIGGTNPGTGWPGLGTFHYFGLVNTAPPASWTKYEITVGPAGKAEATFPTANVRTLRLGFLMNYNNSATTVVEVQDLRIEEMVGATFIENGAITTNKISANAITADKIASNSISTSKLVVTDFTNLCPDAVMLDNKAWLYGDDPAYPADSWGTSSTTEPNFTSARYLILTGAAGSYGSFTYSRWVPVEPGHQYHVGAQTKRTAGTTGGIRYIVEVCNTPSDPASVTALYYPGSLSGTLTYDSLNFTIPANKRHLRIVPYKSSEGNCTAGWFGGAVIRKITPGTLIADGAITTAKVEAQAITAAKIYSGAVQADKIQANNIASGIITAAHIYTGGINANKVQANQVYATSLDALSANLGTVTAGLARSSDSTTQLDLNNKYLYFNNGTRMFVNGINFGSSNQFIQWYGASVGSIPSCTETNAIMFLKNDGSAMFGGRIRGEFEPKAWCALYGEGTPSIKDCYNVSSVTKGGTGIYYVNFHTALPNLNYAAVAGGSDPAKDAIFIIAAQTTATVTIHCKRRGDGAWLDVSILNLIVFGSNVPGSSNVADPDGAYGGGTIGGGIAPGTAIP